MTDTTVAPNPVHLSLWEQIKADIAVVEHYLGVAASYVPAAAQAADVAAVLTGNAELVPAINAASAGITALNTAAHADNVTAALQGVAATVAAAKIIAGNPPVPAPVVASTP